MEDVLISEMKFDQIDGYCRACTRNDSATDMIHLFDSDKNIVAEIYTQCTLLKPYETDGLPIYICQLCHDQLLLFNAFRLSCIEADNFFRSKLIKSEEDTTIDANQTIKEVRLTRKNQSSKRKRSKKSEIEIDKTKVKVENIDISYDDDMQNDNSMNDIDFNHEIDTDSRSEFLTINDIKDEVKVAVRKKSLKKLMLKCDICTKRFFKKHRLEAHMRTHQGLKPYECLVCGKQFVKGLNLKFHMKIDHAEGDLPKYTCSIENCNRTYTRKHTLVCHIKHFHLKLNAGNNERRYTCELCGASFKVHNSLIKHMYTHTGLLPFKCELCPKKYSTKYKLKVHMNRHNGIKNHVCSICGLRKTTGHELRVHMNYHTREKLHECKFCEKKFPNSGNLSRHIKIVHCGIKSFQCPHCERSFGKAETLKHHVMTHTGEKPHGCEICGKRFIQSIALQTHMKTHRKSK